MKLKQYFFLFICVFSLKAFAQDKLYDIYGKEYIGTEVSRNDHYINFKTGDKVLAFRPHFVGVIVHEDGREERFNWERYRSYTDTHLQVKDFKRNVVAMNVADVLFSNLTFSYERISASGKTSFRIPVSFGLGGMPARGPYLGELTEFTFMKNKNYSGGLEFNYYPNGQTRHNYYIGLSALVGSFFYYPPQLDTMPVYAGTASYYFVINPGPKHYGLHYAGMVHIGGNLGVTKNLSIGARLAAGLKREETVIDDYTKFNGQADVTVAYKF